MPLFVGTWRVLDKYRSDYPALVASIEKENANPAAIADANENDDRARMLGRWHNPAQLTGLFAVEAPNGESVYSMLYSMEASRMMSYEIQPMLDDNMLRKVVLGKDPSWQAVYNPDDEAKEGESLYWSVIRLSPENKVNAYSYLARETNIQSKFELGKVRMLARYHDIGVGISHVIVAASSEIDLYQSSLAMSKNWALKGEIKWVPVLKDEGFRNVLTTVESRQPEIKERAMGGTA